jgi:hypothetical protein
MKHNLSPCNQKSNEPRLLGKEVKNEGDGAVSNFQATQK